MSFCLRMTRHDAKSVSSFFSLEVDDYDTCMYVLASVHMQTCTSGYVHTVCTYIHTCKGCEIFIVLSYYRINRNIGGST